MNAPFTFGDDDFNSVFPKLDEVQELVAKPKQLTAILYMPHKLTFNNRFPIKKVVKTFYQLNTHHYILVSFW